MVRIFIIIVSVVMGLSAGASLAESAVMVPFWKEMSPEAFYNWYAANGVRLAKFFGPLQIFSAVGAALAWVWLLLKKERAKWAMLFSLLSALGVLAMFFAYFKTSNAAFIGRSIAADQLPAALQEWGTWQWARVALCTFAFLAALFAIPNDRK